MRGWRGIGRNHPDVLKHIDDRNMVVFAVDPEMRMPRNGGQPVRVRDLKKWYWPHAAVPGAAYDDYLFVATAIGEDCFK